MMRLPPSRFQPSRPNRNARTYSTDCTPASQVPGVRTLVTRPSRTSLPLATRMVPPAATQSSVSRKGRTIRSRASGSTRVSASMAHTRSPVPTHSPVFSASALPPFSLSTTTRAGVVRERRTARTVAIGST